MQTGRTLTCAPGTAYVPEVPPKKNESEGGPALKELAAWKETFQGTDNHRTMGAAWRVVWG